MYTAGNPVKTDEKIKKRCNDLFEDVEVPYRTFRRTKLPKIWPAAENFLCQKGLSAENFVHRNILSAEIQNISNSIKITFKHSLLLMGK